MTPLSTPVTKRLKSHLYRREVMRWNPTLWIFLLLICGCLCYWAWPLYTHWQAIQKDLEVLAPTNVELQTQRETLQPQVEQARLAYNKVASEHLELEKQAFPKQIDTGKIIQILEIYAMLLKRQVSFNSISVGKSVPVERQAQNKNQITSQNYYQTPVNIAISLDKPNLEALINFLHRGKISESLENQISRGSNKGDAASIEFLKVNRLPINNIENLSFNEVTQDTSKRSRALPVYDVKMQVNFYSRSPHQQ